MLIDRYMPAWDVRERHRIRVDAPPERVYAALRTTDLAAHPLARLLLALRAIPAALADGARGVRRLSGSRTEPITLAAFERRGFSVLEEDPPHELLIGLEGAFWRPRGDLRPIQPGSFRVPVPPDLARATWNFRVEPEGLEGCVLSTETRVVAGARARRSFGAYWLLVRPASGLIRRLMLRSLRREAERGAAP